MNNSIYDIIVIGAGHNGLVCASYLAKAGLKVLVLEQWHRVGGCVQTEELIPGFKINPCSVDHILIQSTPVIKELELESRFGLRYLNADPAFSVPWAAVPTTLDPTLAPEGKHSLYLYGIAPKVLSEGRKWNDVKENYADTMIDKMSEYIPNLKNIIIGRHIESPDDLKKRIGDTNAVHIDYFLDQNIIFRPTRKLSGYKTDIKGLYVSGPGTHPGGGVGGIPGRNTANVVLEDIRGKNFGRDTVKYASVFMDLIRSIMK